MNIYYIDEALTLLTEVLPQFSILIANLTIWDFLEQYGTQEYEIDTGVKKELEHALELLFRSTTTMDIGKRQYSILISFTFDYNQ